MNEHVRKRLLNYACFSVAANIVQQLPSVYRGCVRTVLFVRRSSAGPLERARQRPAYAFLLNEELPFSGSGGKKACLRLPSPFSKSSSSSRHGAVQALFVYFHRTHSRRLADRARLEPVLWFESTSTTTEQSIVVSAFSTRFFVRAPPGQASSVHHEDDTKSKFSF